MIFGGIGVIVIIALILVFTLVGGKGFSSPESAAEAFVTASVEVNAEDYLDCLPDFCVCKLAKDYDLNINASRDEVAEAMMEDVNRPDFDDFRIESVRVVDYASDSFYERISNRSGAFRYITNEESASIGEIVKVKVAFYADGRTHTENLYCIEMDGRWFVYPF